MGLIPNGMYVFDLPLYYILVMYPFIFLLFVLPLFARGIKGYKRKVGYVLNQDLKDEYLIDKLAKVIGPYTVVFLLFFIVGLGILNVAGGFNAKEQRTFMVIKSTPELVILRKYSKNFICASFDRKNKEIKKNFYLKNTWESLTFNLDENRLLMKRKKHHHNEEVGNEKNRYNDYFLSYCLFSCLVACRITERSN